MIEAELSFLEEQLKLLSPYAVELCQAVFGVAPERLDAVDVSGASGELIVAVIDPKVLCQAQVNQPQPSVWMTLLGSALPLMMACSVAREALGTISV